MGCGAEDYLSLRYSAAGNHTEAIRNATHGIKLLRLWGVTWDKRQPFALWLDIANRSADRRLVIENDGQVSRFLARMFNRNL